MRVVVKIGSSSITHANGSINRAFLERLCDDIADLSKEGHETVVVTSGAIALGLGAMGYSVRPNDPELLRTAASIGQVELISTYREVCLARGLTPAQMLIIPSDFSDRNQYLHARQTLNSLLSVSALPILNENDALSNEQLRYGDNDKVAALVSNLIGAQLLILLTDQAGLFTSDPRLDHDASLVEEVHNFDHLNVEVGGAGTAVGSGGMATKIQAAKMASWSGVETLIMSSEVPQALQRAVSGDPTLGTRVIAHSKRLPARKLWIAFAAPSEGSVVVDSGARHAVVVQGRSLLPAGVISVEGTFEAGSPISVRDLSGSEFAKGIAQIDDNETRLLMGRRSFDQGVTRYLEVVHRDDLVVLCE